MEHTKLIFHVSSIYVSTLKFYVHFSSAPCVLTVLPIQSPSFQYHNGIQFRSRIMKLLDTECFAVLPHPLCRVTALPSSLHSPRPLICALPLTNVTQFHTHIHTNRQKKIYKFPYL